MKKIKALLTTLFLVLALAMSAFAFSACDISLVDFQDNKMIEELLAEYLDNYLKNTDLSQYLTDEQIKKIIDNYLENADLEDYIDLNELLKDKNILDYIDFLEWVYDPNFNQAFKQLLANENLWDYVDFWNLWNDTRFRDFFSALMEEEDILGYISLMDWLTNENFCLAVMSLLYSELSSPEFEEFLKQYLVEVLEDNPLNFDNPADLFADERFTDALKQFFEDGGMDDFFNEMLREFMQTEEGKDIIRELLGEMFSEENYAALVMQGISENPEFRTAIVEMLVENYLMEVILAIVGGQ